MSNIVARSLSGLALRSPKRSVAVAEHVPAETVGFDRLPKTVKPLLGDHLTGTHLCSGATEALTLRSKDGTTYQHQAGWWLSDQCFVLITVTRDLQPLEDGRFAPSGDWTTKVERREVRDVHVETKRYAKRAHTGTSAGAEEPEQRVVDDPLELLPLPVRQWIGNADYTHGWAFITTGQDPAIEETVVAHRLDGTSLYGLWASRTATDERQLPFADWRIKTIRCDVADPTVTSLAPSPAPTLPERRHRTLALRRAQ